MIIMAAITVLSGGDCGSLCLVKTHVWIAHTSF